MVECPRCKGTMRQGEVVVPSDSTMSPLNPAYGMYPGLGVPAVPSNQESRLRWREKTGATTGRFFRSEEEKDLRISARRCVSCGYIELYVIEEPSR